jgi:hypothetical protein
MLVLVRVMVLALLRVLLQLLYLSVLPWLHQ